MNSRNAYCLSNHLGLVSEDEIIVFTEFDWGVIEELKNDCK